MHVCYSLPMTKRTAARKLTPTQARVFEHLAAGFYGRPQPRPFAPGVYALAQARLFALGLVAMREGRYVLTDAGREHANR